MESASDINLLPFEEISIALFAIVKQFMCNTISGTNIPSHAGTHTHTYTYTYIYAHTRARTAYE